MRILMLGDVYGRAGRAALRARLGDIRRRYRVDMVVANGENLAGGRGLTASVLDEVLSLGVDVVTSGNHVWDQPAFMPRLHEEPRVLRPLNYPPGAPGRGVLVLPAGGKEVAVLNAQGRAFFPSHLDDPFRAVRDALAALPQEVKVRVLDFHAESTAEKQALAQYLDGQVSVVAGTHTHVQTADEVVLPGGTGYLTDLGMTGPRRSVIGVESHRVVQRFLTQLPVRFEEASGPWQLAGALFEVDEASGRTVAVWRVLEWEDEGPRPGTLTHGEE
jgi:metallophosphoesterase (TIGR00282 family)